MLEVLKGMVFRHCATAWMFLGSILTCPLSKMYPRKLIEQGWNSYFSALTKNLFSNSSWRTSWTWRVYSWKLNLEVSHRGVETGLPLIPLLYPGQVVGILQVELGENGSPKEGFEGQVDQGTEYLFFLVIFLERRTLHLQERKRDGWCWPWGSQWCKPSLLLSQVRTVWRIDWWVKGLQEEDW